MPIMPSGSPNTAAAPRPDEAAKAATISAAAGERLGRETLREIRRLRILASDREHRHARMGRSSPEIDVESTPIGGEPGASECSQRLRRAHLTSGLPLGMPRHHQSFPRHANPIHERQGEVDIGFPCGRLTRRPGGK